jgi:signal peptidase I
MASETVVPSSGQTRARLNWKRAWIAFVLSILQPGLGHIYNHQLARAISYLVFAPALLFFAHLTGFHHSFRGFVVLLVLQLGLGLFMIANAFWIGLQYDRTPPQAPARSGMLVFALLLAALNFAGTVSGYSQDHLLGLHAYVMRAESMAPTLLNADRIVVDTLAYVRGVPGRGDLVVFVANAPGRVLWIKRVIGIGGDTVVASEDGVFLNGQRLQESYIAQSSSSEDLGESGHRTYHVPNGQYFMMGDNRADSFDSRFPDFGAIDSKRIIGKPLFIYWSAIHARIGRELR